MQQTVEGRLDRIETMLNGLRQTVEKCTDMVWSLVATRDEMRGVLKWQKEKESQRNRTKKSRDKSKEEAQKRMEEHRTWSVQNNPNHGLDQPVLKIYSHSDEAPGVRRTMMNVMTRLLRDQVPDANPTEWFFGQLEMHDPEYIIRFLACLYNRSFWAPWVVPKHEKFHIFVTWGDNDTASTKLKNKGDITCKTEPPAKWDDGALEKFQNAAIWNVFELLYSFLEREICAGKDLTDDTIFERLKSKTAYWDLFALMSSTSEEKVFQDHAWEVPMLSYLNRAKALKLYRKVSHRLHILQTAFLAGISQSHDDLKQYFAIPK